MVRRNRYRIFTLWILDPRPCANIALQSEPGEVKRPSRSLLCNAKKELARCAFETRSEVYYAIHRPMLDAPLPVLVVDRIASVNRHDTHSTSALTSRSQQLREVGNLAYFTAAFTRAVGAARGSVSRLTRTSRLRSWPTAKNRQPLAQPDQLRSPSALQSVNS